MIPVTQTKVVVRNSKGEMIVRGNCFPACIASLLELPIQEVPNVELFMEENNANTDWIDVINMFLAKRGLTYRLADEFKCFHPELVELNESFENNDNNRREWISAMQHDLKDKY